MGKRILFSPVGGTDPIKYCSDGSMLHICDYSAGRGGFIFVKRNDGKTS